MRACIRTTMVSTTKGFSYHPIVMAMYLFNQTRPTTNQSLSIHRLLCGLVTSYWTFPYVIASHTKVLPFSIHVLTVTSETSSFSFSHPRRSSLEWSRCWRLASDWTKPSSEFYNKLILTINTFPILTNAGHVLTIFLGFFFRPSSRLRRRAVEIHCISNRNHAFHTISLLQCHDFFFRFFLPFPLKNSTLDSTADSISLGQDVEPCLVSDLQCSRMSWRSPDVDLVG